MKHLRFQVSDLKKLVLFFVILLCSPHVNAQDTLHLVYHHTQIKPHDSTEAKIDTWIKKLNGKHVEIQIVAYYHKLEFKKFAQERVDELFLVLNRKAREQLTFDFYGTKKGSDELRTTVDIIYKKVLSPEELAAAKAKEEAAAKKAKEEEEAAKKKKDEEKAAKDSEKKTKSEVAAEQTSKGGDKKTTAKVDNKGKEEKKDSNAKSKDREQKGDDERADKWDNGDYGQSIKMSFNEGGALTQAELQYIKRAKFIVAMGGTKEVDEDLYNAVKNFWDFNKNISQMTYEEATKLRKENKKDTIVILSFVKIDTWFNDGKLRIRYIGYGIGLENAKGKTLFQQAINKPRGKHPTYTSLCFAASVLNDVCHTMEDSKLSKSSKMDPIYDERSSEVLNKKLYVPEFMMHPKLPTQDIGLYYTGPVSLVSNKDWEKAILEKKDVAYVCIAMMPRPPQGYFYYIMDAKTGKVLYVDQGPKVQVSLGWGINSMAPSQSGFVDKANFERFESGIKKAIADNNNRVENKTKDAAKEKEKATAKEAKEKQKEKEKEKENKDDGAKKNKSKK